MALILRDLILELQAVAAKIGDEAPVKVEYGGQEHDATSVSFEGSTNETHVIIHG